MRDIYESLQNPIRPMGATNMTHMRKKPHFADALQILDQFGLIPLMELQCDYSPAMITQFYSTVVFCGDEHKTMKWMSGTEPCEAILSHFGSLLGYKVGEGRRMHGAGDHTKNQMSSLYDTHGKIGYMTGLLPLYSQLDRLLRDNLHPSGGNNDAIRSSLVELLCLAQKCAENEVPGKDFRIDVMDYIHAEMYEAMINRALCHMLHIS